MTKVERNYVTWYLRENAKKYCLIILLLLVALPLISIMMPGKDSIEYSVTPMMTQIFVVAILGSFLSLGFALYNFRYLVNKRAVGMYFGMPIKKSRMFVIQYAIGAISIFVLLFVMFGLSIVLDPMTQANMSVYWVYNLSVALLCVCLYTMYVAIIMKCNNAWDACLVCVGYTILPCFIFLALSQMLNSTLSTTLYSNISSADEFFPMMFILECLSIPAVMIRYGTAIVSNSFNLLQGYSTKTSLWDGILTETDFSLWFILFWVVVAIVLFFVARRLYVKRGSEASEQRTLAYLCYPFLSLLLASTLIMFDAYPYKTSFGISFTFPITMIFISFIIYLVMNFFARRKIQCTKGMILSFVGVVIGVFALQYTCVYTKGFYQVKEIPAFDEVAAVNVFGNFHFDEDSDHSFTFQNPKHEIFSGKFIPSLNMKKESTDSAIINQVYQIHEDILEKETASEVDRMNYSVQNDGSVGFGVTYVLKGGRQISRVYTVAGIDSEEIITLFENLVDQGLCGNEIQAFEWNSQNGPIG